MNGPEIKGYKITGQQMIELLHAVKSWSEKHSIDNMGVVAATVKHLGQLLEDVAAKHNERAEMVLSYEAPKTETIN